MFSKFVNLFKNLGCYYIVWVFVLITVKCYVLHINYYYKNNLCFALVKLIMALKKGLCQYNL